METPLPMKIKALKKPCRTMCRKANSGKLRKITNIMRLNCLVVERATTFFTSSWERAQTELEKSVRLELSPMSLRAKIQLPPERKGCKKRNK